MTSIITKTIYLDASRQTVWSFLTESKKLAAWFHEADADLAPGQPFELMHRPESTGEGRICWGEVVTMEPPSLLVHTFTFDAIGGAPTTVTWRLEEAHGGTKLTLVHEGIEEAAGQATAQMVMALDAGWDEHFGRLRPAVAQTKAA